MFKLKSLCILLSCVTIGFSINSFAATNNNDSSNTETTGQYLEGTSITASVKAKLLADTDIKSFDISVDTVNGVVTLTGMVDTKDQIKKAAAIAKTVDGVKRVDNQLTVKTTAQ